MQIQAHDTGIPLQQSGSAGEEDLGTVLQALKEFVITEPPTQQPGDVEACGCSSCSFCALCATCRFCFGCSS